jgi:membrane protein YqaA with SNARE-associated domain
MSTPAARPDSVIRRRVSSFARTPACVALVLAWAFLEAIDWPIVPEVLLVSLVLAAPAMWLRLSLVALFAGVIGGVVMLGLAGAGAVPPQLLVTDAMRASADEEVAEAGARAVYTQPLSGVPYKAYATAAGEQGVSAPAFAMHSALARGARFLIVAAVAAFAAVALRRWRRYYPAAVLILLGGFTAGLTTVVTSS